VASEILGHLLDGAPAIAAASVGADDADVPF
jgi:hypothetical protein